MNHPDSEKFNTAAIDGTVSREIGRMEANRASWREAAALGNSIANQIKELTQGSSAIAEITKSFSAAQLAASTINQQYRELIEESSFATQAIRQWQESQRIQQESIQKMLAPLADLRKSFLSDSSLQRLGKEFAEGSSIHQQVKDILGQTEGISAAAKIWAKQMEEAQIQRRKAFEDYQLASGIRNYLKDFERINKSWTVPSEVLGMVASLRAAQERYGKVSIPTIDWASAAALAQLLGRDGIEEQLSHLGIEADGSLDLNRSQAAERGILSRRQQDVTALISLLLTIFIFIYQEFASSHQQVQDAAFKAQTAATLQIQAQQLQSLSTLIEEALVQVSTDHDERFVVRERTATVRTEPQHGAPVEGRLLPNEVVRGIDRHGMWVEVEYYHWLHEEYRTGWVLKKYLERVPASYGKTQTDPHRVKKD